MADLSEPIKPRFGVAYRAIIIAVAAELLRMVGFYWLVLHLTAFPWLSGEATRQLVVLAFGIANLTVPSALVLIIWLGRRGVSADRGAVAGTLLNVLRLIKVVGIFVLLAGVASRFGQRAPAAALTPALFSAIIAFDLISLWVLLSLRLRPAQSGAADREEGILPDVPITDCPGSNPHPIAAIIPINGC